VLRGWTQQALLWHGRVLVVSILSRKHTGKAGVRAACKQTSSHGARRRLGPDILAQPPDIDAMLANLRALPQRTQLGEALQLQRAVAGIGNMWMNEALFDARISPWLTLAEATDDELRGALTAAARLMQGRLAGVRARHRVYRRKNRACPRCGALVRSWPLGEDARMAYWCPACQKGEGLF